MSEEAPSFSIRSIFSEAVKEFGSPDRGFFRTTWLMITAPGHTLRKIFTGEEKNVTSPFRYFLLAYTLYAIVYVSSGANDIYIADQVVIAKQQSADTLKLVNSLFEHSYKHKLVMTDEDIRQATGFNYILQYPLISTLVMLVLLWLASLLALFHFQMPPGQRLSVSLYIFGVTTLMQLPLVFLVFLHMSPLLGIIAQFLLIFYLSWSMHTYDKSKHRFGFARGILWFVIWLFLSMCLTIAFGFKVGIDVALRTIKEQHQTATPKITPN
jgi:hypothetical protein